MADFDPDIYTIYTDTRYKVGQRSGNKTIIKIIKESESITTFRNEYLGCRSKSKYNCKICPTECFFNRNSSRIEG